MVKIITQKSCLFTPTDDERFLSCFKRFFSGFFIFPQRFFTSRPTSIAFGNQDEKLRNIYCGNFSQFGGGNDKYRSY